MGFPPNPTVFILTGVRCGSTLLKAMLDRHPRLFAPPELNLWPYATFEDAQLQFRHTHLALGLTETLTRLFGSQEEAEAQVRQFELDATPVPGIMSWIRRRIGDRILVDKSPTYPMSPATLERMERLGADPGTEPRYVLLTRHPLDVFESMQRNRFDKLLKMLTVNARRLRRHRPESTSDWFDAYIDTPDNACRDELGIAQSNYLRAMAHCRDFLAGIDEHRWLRIGYEALVENPEREMRRLCALIDVQFEAAMLDPYGTDTVTAESVQDPNFHQHKSIDPISDSHRREQEQRWAATELTESTRQIARQLDYTLPAAPSCTSLTPSQQRFITEHGGPAPLFIVMAQDLELTAGQFDRKRLERVVDSLAEQLPALRAAFEQRDECWIQRHAAHPLPGCIRFEDVRAVADAAALEALIARAVETAKDEIDPVAGQPWRILLFRTGSRAYRVVHVFHHLITDGMSLLWFDRALWQRYFEADADHPPPPALAPDYATGLQLARREHDLADDLTFYRGLVDVPDAVSQRLCEAERGEGPDSVRERAVRIALPRRGRSGLSFDAVALALHQVVGELTRTRRPLIAHRLARRDALRRSGHEHWMSWIAGDAPVRIGLDADNAEQRRQLRAALRALPLAGVGYDWLVEDGELPALDSLAAVRLNYVPAVRPGQHAGARFGQPDVRAHLGAGVRPEFPIDFLVREFDDELEVIVRHARRVVDELRVEWLLGRWRSHFEAITADLATTRSAAGRRNRRAAV